MKKQKLKYFPILPSEESLGSERSDYVRRWIDEYLIPNDIVTMNEKEANAYLVAAGDGGMTKAARMTCRKKKLLLGINCGTLGFLMNQFDGAPSIPVERSELHTVSVNLMKGTFYCKDGSVHEYLAFNDVFCGGNIADFVSFKISGSLSHFRNRTVNGNGVFLSTPQGTTGFALNARGSSAVLPLDTKTWYIGGVATGPYPDSVFTPQKVEIIVESRKKVFGYADGYEQEAKDIERVVVEPTKHRVTLAFQSDVDFEARRCELAQKAELGSHG